MAANPKPVIDCIEDKKVTIERIIIEIRFMRVTLPCEFSNIIIT